MDRHAKWLRRRIVASVATQTALAFAVVAVLVFALLQWRTGVGFLAAVFISLVVGQLVALARVVHAVRSNPLDYASMRRYVDIPFTFRVSRFEGPESAHPVADRLPGFEPVASIRDNAAHPEPVFDIYHDPSRLVAASVNRTTGAISLVSSLENDRVLMTNTSLMPPHERLVMTVSPKKSIDSLIDTHRRAISARTDVIELSSSAHQVVLESLAIEHESYVTVGAFLSPFLDLDPANSSRARLMAKIDADEFTRLPTRLGPDFAKGDRGAPAARTGEARSATEESPPSAPVPSGATNAQLTTPQVIAPQVIAPQITEPTMTPADVVARDLARVEAPVAEASTAPLPSDPLEALSPEVSSVEPVEATVPDLGDAPEPVAEASAAPPGAEPVEQAEPAEAAMDPVAAMSDTPPSNTLPSVAPVIHATPDADAVAESVPASLDLTSAIALPAAVPAVNNAVAASELPIAGSVSPTVEPVNNAGALSELPIAGSVSPTVEPVNNAVALSDLPIADPASPTVEPVNNAVAASELPIADSASPVEPVVAVAPVAMPVADVVAPATAEHVAEVTGQNRDRSLAQHPLSEPVRVPSSLAAYLLAPADVVADSLKTYVANERGAESDDQVPVVGEPVTGQHPVVAPTPVGEPVTGQHPVVALTPVAEQPAAESVPEYISQAPPESFADAIVSAPDTPAALAAPDGAGWPPPAADETMLVPDLSSALGRSEEPAENRPRLSEVIRANTPETSKPSGRRSRRK